MHGGRPGEPLRLGENRRECPRGEHHRLARSGQIALQRLAAQGGGQGARGHFPSGWGTAAARADRLGRRAERGAAAQGRPGQHQPGQRRLLAAQLERRIDSAAAAVRRAAGALDVHLGRVDPAVRLEQRGLVRERHTRAPRLEGPGRGAAASPAPSGGSETNMYYPSDPSSSVFSNFPSRRFCEVPGGGAWLSCSKFTES
mmetsp:Transcript_26721/g.61154  ORF Transcript_26721/g.61154 Transcript_26721/m.61154 type:complete len:200 (+) Transcript_26721:949-1548(+)